MRTQLLLLTLVAGLAACGDRSAPDADGAADAQPREVHFTATDFAFEGPREIEAGLIELVLTNEAETWHHLQLLHIPEGMTFDQMTAAMSEVQPGSPFPDWYHDVGGVNPPPPGGPATVTLQVEPGEYAVVCIVDIPDHVPHVMKGMIQPLTVTPSAHAAAALPEADLTLTLADYAFGFSAPPTSGTHVVRVVNEGLQSHEVVLFRFLPGKTMDDLMAWGEAYEGESPIEPVGGVPGIAVGQAVNMDVTFSPGEYVALCFLPDATDGALHLVHGMALPFNIS